MAIYATDEREMLTGLLDVQRQAIVGLLDDLGEDEARLRLVPSLTTPLGLVKHAVFVEKVWFHSRVAGVHRRELGLPDSIDDSFTLDADDTIETTRAAFVDACEKSRTITEGRDLDEEFTWHRGEVNLRFIFGHMIAEFARHSGHGDILVEQIRARRD